MQSTVFFSFNSLQQTVHFLCVTHIRNPKETVSKTFVNHVEQNVLVTGINCSAFNWDIWTLTDSKLELWQEVTNNIAQIK